MKREIKFRAWVDSDKKMYDVLQWQDKFPDEGFYRVFINKQRIEGQPMNYRITGRNALMQYVGLLDKNGKKIYEGDIVSVYGEKRVVEFKNAFWRLELHDAQQIGGFGTPVESGHKPLYRYGTDWIEVIGNIFENPELEKQLSIP